MNMYNEILLAADGSENSFRAAEESLNFIHEDSVVTILNVINSNEIKKDVLHQKSSESLKTKRKEKLSKIIELYKEQNIHYELYFEYGIPDETVVSFANNGPFQLVVLGSRGLNSFQEMVMGSVSHKVVKRVKKPVIIVK